VEMSDFRENTSRVRLSGILLFWSDAKQPILGFELWRDRSATFCAAPMMMMKEPEGIAMDNWFCVQTHVSWTLSLLE
jgi:hypothetical protein